MSGFFLGGGMTALIFTCLLVASGYPSDGFTVAILTLALFIAYAGAKVAEAIKENKK
jgi:hypothetical protein